MTPGPPGPTVQTAGKSSRRHTRLAPDTRPLPTTRQASPSPRCRPETRATQAKGPYPDLRRPVSERWPPPAPKTGRNIPSLHFRNDLMPIPRPRGTCTSDGRDCAFRSCTVSRAAHSRWEESQLRRSPPEQEPSDAQSFPPTSWWRTSLSSQDVKTSPQTPESHKTPWLNLQILCLSAFAQTRIHYRDIAARHARVFVWTSRQNRRARMKLAYNNKKRYRCEEKLIGLYVDNAQIPYRQMKMSHLVADTSAELRRACRALGLRESYIQHAGAPKEHLDVSASRRLEAIRRLGAKPISSRRIMVIIQARRRAMTRRMKQATETPEEISRPSWRQ